MLFTFRIQFFFSFLFSLLVQRMLSRANAFRSHRETFLIFQSIFTLTRNSFVVTIIYNHFIFIYIFFSLFLCGAGVFNNKNKTDCVDLSRGSWRRKKIASKKTQQQKKKRHNWRQFKATIKYEERRRIFQLKTKAKERKKPHDE